MSATLTIQAANFTGLPLVNTLVALKPLYVSSVAGVNIITTDRITAYTDSSGIALFSGVVSGNYSVDIFGPRKHTAFNIAVTSGNQNAKDIII